MTTVPEAVSALEGCTITKLVIDDSVHMALQSRSLNATLRIDTAGEVRNGESKAQFDPDAAPESLTAIVPLLHQRIGQAKLEDDGSLVVTAGPWELRVPFHDHEISWSISTSTSAQASCLAEGFVVWQ